MRIPAHFSVPFLIFKRYRWHIVALIALGFLSAILEGIGINAVIPLLSFFTGSGGAATDFVTRTIQGLFSFFHIPFSFRYLLGFILSLFVLRAVAMVIFGYIRGWISADFLGKESEDVLGRMLSASWPFLLKQKIGALHNTLVRDIQNTGALLDVTAQIVQSLSGLLMYLLVAINISPLMTLYTLGGGAIVLFVVRPLLSRTRRIGEQAATAEKQFAQFLSEHILSMKFVKAAGVERQALASGIAHTRLLRALSIRQAFVRSISSSLFQPAVLALVVMLFALTYRTPGFSIIAFAATLYLIQKIFAYLESGQNALLGMNGLLPYAQNVLTLKNTLSEHREQTSASSKTFLFKKSLAFNQVSFSYANAQPLLIDVSFTINKGDTVGLIGPSGAGKTSVADLLLHLFRPTKGSIVVDGELLEAVPSDVWRHRVGYVAQDIFLLNTSVEENIRFYRTGLSHDAIVRAAQQANIYDFVMQLPEGFTTATGDRGVMLSGGQRQRIALARALAGKPDVLILDEATSALDHESERLIHAAIKALHGKVTVLIIAHRPSTVAEADVILVLDRGKIVEHGAPAELLKNLDSYFSKMQKR